MKYFKIPIIEKKPDISELDNFELLFYVGDNATVYGIFIDGIIRDSWEEITEQQFEEFTTQSESDEKINFIEQLNDIQKKLIELEEVTNQLINLSAIKLENDLNPLAPSAE